MKIKRWHVNKKTIDHVSVRSTFKRQGKQATCKYVCSLRDKEADKQNSAMYAIKKAMMLVTKYEKKQANNFHKCLHLRKQGIKYPKCFNSIK